MVDPDRIEPSGFSLRDTKEIFAIFNKCACGLAGQEVDRKTIIRRLRIVASWLTESADIMEGISAEEKAHMDIERFWRSRANGARGDDA